MPHHLKTLTPKLVVADESAGSIAFLSAMVAGFQSPRADRAEAEPFVFCQSIKIGRPCRSFLNAPSPGPSRSTTGFKGPAQSGGTADALRLNVDDIRGFLRAAEGIWCTCHCRSRRIWLWGPNRVSRIHDSDGYIVTFAEIEFSA
jgi:hypothetical protein